MTKFVVSLLAGAVVLAMSAPSTAQGGAFRLPRDGKLGGEPDLKWSDWHRPSDQREESTARNRCPARAGLGSLRPKVQARKSRGHCGRFRRPLPRLTLGWTLRLIECACFGERRIQHVSLAWSIPVGAEGLEDRERWRRES